MGLLSGVRRGESGLVTRPPESREREDWVALAISSRWYWCSFCWASDPRIERGCEVAERELWGEGGGRVGSLDGKLAGWNLGRLDNPSFFAGRRSSGWLAADSDGTGAAGERGDVGLYPWSGDPGRGPMATNPRCTFGKRTAGWLLETLRGRVV